MVSPLAGFGSINIPPPPHSPYAPIPPPPRRPLGWGARELAQHPLAKVREFGRNLNQNQMGPGNSRFMSGAQRVLDATQTAQHFRHAGMGEAIRYTLGLSPMPAKLEPYYRARLYQQGGIAPGTMYPARHPQTEPGGFDVGEVGGD